MTNRRTPTEVKPAALLAAIAVLALIFGVLLWRNFGPGAGTPASTLTAQQQEEQAWLKKKAKESGGDIRKLSPEDQQKLVALHGQQAAAILKGNASAASDSY